jgi:hypothetical protein
VAAGTADGGACNGETAPTFPSRKREGLGVGRNGETTPKFPSRRRAGWTPLPLRERVAQTYERAR